MYGTVRNFSGMRNSIEVMTQAAGLVTRISRQGLNHGLKGSCLCGSVSVTISTGALPTHDPAYCHCNHCRLFHAAPFALEAGWSLSNVEISGDTIPYSQSKSRVFERHRCAVCGTACGGIHHKLKGGTAFIPTTLLVAAGAELPEVLKPKLHLFYSRRIIGDDLFNNDGLPKYDEFPT